MVYYMTFHSKHLLETPGESESEVTASYGDQTSLDVAFILRDVDIYSPGSSEPLVTSK